MGDGGGGGGGGAKSKKQQTNTTHHYKNFNTLTQKAKRLSHILSKTKNNGQVTYTGVQQCTMDR